MKLIDICLTIIASMIGSTGLWAFISRLLDRKSAYNKMVLGLAHYRIIKLGETYIARGSITTAEYENLHDYLYEPYRAAGGNGTAEKIMKEVDKLPIKDD